MIGVGQDSPIHPVALLTVPAYAGAIGADLRAGRSPTVDTLRFVRETINNARFVIDDDLDRIAFFARPSPTGDQRWDALLAGVVDLVAREHQFDPPTRLRRSPTAVSSSTRLFCALFTS